MTVSFPGFAAPRRLALSLLAAAVLASTFTAFAKTSSKSKSKPAAMSKHATKSPPAEPAFALPAPSPEQVDAAGRVYYGVYDCEFKQTIDIAASKAHPSYVDLRLARAGYLMKPVLSSTGAIRLEDVKGELLMVQIASKSMLLNVKTAQRIVDDCITEKQRQLIEAARVAKAAQAERAAAAAAAAARAAAASPASAPSTAMAPEPPPSSGLLISPASPAASAAAGVPDAAPGTAAASGAAAPAAPQGAASSPQP